MSEAVDELAAPVVKKRKISLQFLNINPIKLTLYFVLSSGGNF